MKNSDKIILDLCGGTGSWSRPYKDAGYDVRVITLPEYDVRVSYIDNDKKFAIFQSPSGIPMIEIRVKDIYGILAAPPCTMFSIARTKAKTPRDLKQGMECVRSCLDIIWKCQENKVPTATKKTKLKFWALENPASGMLKYFLGSPAYIFNPWMFGDHYKKDTSLWGNFNEPKRLFERPTKMMKKFDKLSTKEIHGEFYGQYDRQTRRSITPQGFAKAFYEANP